MIETIEGSTVIENIKNGSQKRTFRKGFLFDYKLMQNFLSNS